MKIGAFGLIEDYKKISEAGYDYAELDMPEIEALNDEQYGALKEQLEQLGFPVISGARLFPIAEPLFFTPGFSCLQLKDYVMQTCKKSAGVGIKKIIMGNGKARSLLEEGNRKKEKNIVDLIRMICEIAGENGQEFILEPLGPRYSNYINQLPEAVEMIQKADMPNAFIMADLRHMVWNKESFEHLVSCKPYIHHIHIDYPISYPERKYPCVEDDYNYIPFLQKIKESGYDDTLTVEADRPKDWKKAYKDIERVIAQADI